MKTTRGGEELKLRILTANAQGRVAFIPFVPAAFPSADSFWTAFEDLNAGGADIIEIGVPFSDPVADGTVIAEASQKAIENGGSLDYIFNGLRRRVGQYSCGLVLMGYFNPFLQYGPERLARECEETGVHGLIIPDLPIDEDAEFRAILSKHGVALISLVGPNTSRERMALYAEAEGRDGFVYVVSALGTTGVRKDFQATRDSAMSTLILARTVFDDLPLALGFGISTREQFDSAQLPADAAVVGSALVRFLAQGGSAADFATQWHRSEKK